MNSEQKMPSRKFTHTALTAESNVEDSSDRSWALEIMLGEVVEILSEVGCEIKNESGRRMPCGYATLLHPLVVGDRVLVAGVAANDDAAVVSILVPHPGSPLADRPLSLSSQQQIRLSTGNATFTLTAGGLARVVAQRIEHDARDAAVIEAGEIRMN